MSHHNIDLKALASYSSHDRAFLSVYLKEPAALHKIKKRADSLKKILRANSDEHRHLSENLKRLDDYFEKHHYPAGSLCIFCCWLIDYLEIFPLEIPVNSMLRIDSSPYIRPLAELKDDYENFAVVIADNRISRIFLVASGKEAEEDKVAGNIKNHVKVGGWSQQRYERRRHKQLKHYAREIIEKLFHLDRSEEFRRIILVGSRETIEEIKKNLPPRLASMLVGEKALDLGRGSDFIHQEIFDLFMKEERRSERHLWEEIQAHYMRGELAAIGMDDVLLMAQAGQVEKVIINRQAKIRGIRCRDCEGLSVRRAEKCPHCGSDSIFEVDLINEIVELLAIRQAEADFTDGIEELEQAGNIAALLRY